jgi:hypothetical protein
MLEIQRSPTPRDLAWFGLALALFFTVIGAVVLWRTGSTTAARALWAVAAAVAILYYAVPPLRRPLFVGWSFATFPIGWVLSYAVMGAIFYLLLTPIGLLVRALHRDPMERSLEPEQSSYWVPRPPPPEPRRYFRQF